ncbi:DUF4062 domain-containing protein [Yersinia enterocolitica]
MEEKKYQIFVSSTYEDLYPARKKIIETILSLYHFPVGMEMFSADDADQWEIIEEMINTSDYYVIVIGHRYGSLSPEGISYTEKEYNYAKSLGIPVLSFIRGRDVATKPHERENNTDLAMKLDQFIVNAKANKMCDFWVGEDELINKVTIALTKIFSRTPRVGWVRGDQAISKEISQELASLSSENRHLRDKVIEYEAKLIRKKPALELCIFSKEPIIFFYEKAESNIKLTSHLNYDVITPDLKGYLTTEQIDEYNQKLPTIEAINKHNKLHQYYTNLINNSLTLEPILANNGTQSASNIHITINIPDFLGLIKDYDKEKTTLPHLDIPQSPLEIAKNRLRINKSPMGIAARNFFGNDNLSSFISNNRLSDDFLYNTRVPLVAPLNVNTREYIDGKTLTLKAKSLLHTLELSFSQITFLPLGIGSGNITIKIICEEMEEEIILTREVTVIEKS